eukprot:11183666-Lingulodinium_polyedra.AAC.1
MADGWYRVPGTPDIVALRRRGQPRPATHGAVAHARVDHLPMSAGGDGVRCGRRRDARGAFPCPCWQLGA